MRQRDYDSVEVIFESPRVIVRRARRDSDRRRVILKSLGPNHRPIDRQRLRNEYELERVLALPSVVEALALEQLEGHLTLVLADFGGEPLDRILGAPMDPGRFLPLAIAIARALASVQEVGVIHKDLKPGNILLNRATGELRLSDFGLASRTPERLAAPSPFLEGSLAYMSPEQTGRMNQVVDGRADLYALGVVFYEMLVGRRPFEASDPLAWAHCHVAQAPQAPTSIIRSIPPTLEAIVLRLLQKRPDDRYQTALGLVRDLEHCHAEWLASGAIGPMALGANDAPDRLQTPKTLHGRASQESELLDRFEWVKRSGQTAFVLVKGPAGIGKSALVRKLGQSTVVEGGLFLEGKFDQYTRNVPYSPIVQAFRLLVEQILTQDEETVSAWRGRILEALGDGAQLIIDVIPELEVILGPQPPVPVPELAPVLTQNRFTSVFSKLVGACAEGVRSVTLFLDDLQWADEASLRLIQRLASTPELGRLLLVGAYRDAEVARGHPLMALLDDLERARIPVYEITLLPLTLGDLTRLLGDMLRAPPEETSELAEVLEKKTGGNPFFAIQFVSALANERLLVFEPARRAWRWDLEAIRARGSTENVVDLMVERLRRLPEETREVVEIAACLGGSLERDVLAKACDRPSSEVQAALRPALQEGLFLASGARYQFLHDRVQQAALAGIEPGALAARHLAIGRRLLRGTSEQALEDQLFDVMNQLQLGAACLVDGQERLQIAALSLRAGKKAKASIAYGTATQNLALGLSLLPAGSWQAHYELALALHLELAECQWLSGRGAEAKHLLARVHERAKNRADRARAYWLQLNTELTLGQIDRSVLTAIECLELFDIHVPLHPTYGDAAALRDEVRRRLGPSSAATLLGLPSMHDEEMELALSVLSAMYAPSFFTDPKLFFVHLGEIVLLSLDHGIAPASVPAIALYGFALYCLFDEHEEANRFGQAASDLLRDRDLDFGESQVVMTLELLAFWSLPLERMLEYARAGFDVAMKSGDLPTAAFLSNHLLTDLLTIGEPLPEVYEESVRRAELVRRFGFSDIEDIIISIQRFIQCLQGRTHELGDLGYEAGEEERFEASLHGRMSIMCVWWHILKLQARFLADRLDEAMAAARDAEALLWATAGHIQLRDFVLYRALTLSAWLERHPLEREAHLPTIEDAAEKLGVWAARNPETFLDQRELIGAELARLSNRELEAERLYEEAIRAAGESGLVHHQAIAYERAASFHRARGLTAIADNHAREAFACWARWGATGMAAKVQHAYPHLALEESPLSASSTFTIPVGALDLLSAVKASQSISEELSLEPLVARLLRVALEQGGARKGFLLRPRGKELVIKAEARSGEGGIEVTQLEAPPRVTAERAPTSVLNFAWRTRAPVIIEDAQLSLGRFAQDEYLARVRPRTVVCLPIVRQREVTGLLYLENELIVGAFSRTRLAALELLAAQAAISLENAMLHERERERRAQAEEAERSAAFLAEAGVILSSSLSLEDVLAQLARLVLVFPADWCILDLFEGNKLRRIAGIHRDPDKQHLIEVLSERYPTRRDSPHPIAVVLRTGAPVLLSELGREELRSLAYDEAHAQLLEALGARSLIAVPLQIRGTCVGALALATGSETLRYVDADLARAEELARRASVAVENARLYQRSEEAIQLRDEFLSVASHELNTPLTSLRLNVKMLLSSKSDERLSESTRREILTRLDRQVERVIRLTSELLDVTRMQRGPIELSLEDLDLETTTRDVLGRMDAERERADCPVILETASAPGRWDRSRIEQVVGNLFANALKFGAGRPITVRVDREDGFARLTVKDEGIGVAPDRQSRIFERFERAVPARNYGGLGLGLYITRQIVEAHGGSISVESAPGEGATFVVLLPARPHTLSTAPTSADEVPSTGVRRPET